MDAREIDGGIFAAPIDFEFELKAIAFVQCRHSGAFDGADVHEGIGLAVIALNEAEALHCVKELDRAGRLFPGQLALRPAATGGAFARRTLLHRDRLAFDLQVGRRNATATIDQRETKRLAFGKTGQPGLLDRADVHEHVFAAIVADDEAETLLRVEEFDDARAFANDLGRHAPTGTAAAATAETAAAATAEAIATTAESVAATEAVTAAEAIATAKAATEAVTTAEAAIKAAIAETVALVPAAPAAITAAPFIETHALFVFPVRP